MRNYSEAMSYYEALLAHFGSSQWWPARSPFEVAVGAVLTQNTAWGNVEKAIVRLDAAGALNPVVMWNMPVADLEECIRPSGFFRLKAQRLRALLQFLYASCYEDDATFADSSFAYLADKNTPSLRADLLAIKGIGPETADSILLYALQRPVFVVDAYTYRIFSRHGLVGEEDGYDEIQSFFTCALPEDVALFNEYHALIVRAAKAFCKKTKPLCSQCPLGNKLEYDIVGE